MFPAQFGLNWLQRQAKDLRTPSLVFTPSLPDAGGYFYHPQKAELLVDGKLCSLERGILLVVPCEDQQQEANSIAHEWRHYWQWFNMTRKFRSAVFHMDREYWREIKRFFKHPRELDALIFSNRVAPSYTTDLWLVWTGHGEHRKRRPTVHGPYMEKTHEIQ